MPSLAGEPASVGGMVGSFFVIWTLAFAVEMGAADVAGGGPAQGRGAGRDRRGGGHRGCIYLPEPQPEGWESNRALAIGIGGGLGWFMMLNVWGIIWRMQKKMIRWTEDNVTKGTALPPEAPRSRG